jgi:hypothetical protein
MTQTVYVRFSYSDKVSQEIPIHLGVNVDLTKNSNRKKLLNALLKQNPRITEATLMCQLPNCPPNRPLPSKPGILKE